MQKPTPIKTKTSTVLKFLGGALLALLAADLQAQFLYKTKFSAVEGYTNGWAIGQPSIGNQWKNANADFDWVRANGDPATYEPMNTGAGSTNEDGSIFCNVTATNTTAPEGGQMKIAADNNQNDGIHPADFLKGRGTYFFKMDFPTTRRGPITVTWDWSYHNTNEIPADFDPTNNSYLGRTPFQQRYDLALQHTLTLKGRHRIEIGANIDNVLDLETVTDYNQTINRNSLRLGDDVYFSPNGFDPWALMNQVRAQGTSMRYNPLVVNPDGTYNTKPYRFMGRRAFRFQVRYSF